MEMVLSWIRGKSPSIDKNLENMKYKYLIAFLTLLVQACQSSTKESQETTLTNTDEITSDSLYLEQGKKIAGATFAALSSALQKALAEGGVQEALSYCNIAALPLTDSLSEVHQATIRRSSLQLRNPANTPSKEEMTMLETYQRMAKANQPLKPTVKRTDAAIHFYAPIKINAFCLQCHGKVGKDISEEDYAFINKLYPEDRAIDYEDGHFRGIWSIALPQ